MNNKKVLIIKTGYSEVLDEEDNSRRVSFGDVLRTTVLLHLFKNDKVTWVTDKFAFPLLENNPFIERLLPYDFTTALQLKSEEFDVVINLEKVPGICALADNVRARRARFGFTLNTHTGRAEPYDKAYDVLTVSANVNLKKENQRTFQELLFEMVGSKWNGEEYVLGYQPSVQKAYNLGLNDEVGSKWPVKRWSEGKWSELERKLSEKGFSLSRQTKQDRRILIDLRAYMDWLNSCELIISGDSLGLHLAIALKKKVLGLFGPTSHKEIHFYGLGKPILPEEISSCMPCFEKDCQYGEPCLEKISPQKIAEEAEVLLRGD
ncbi:MAG: glycosyltransferase family 9 protein [Nanoarchaeota archaeon]|nr:glycosyltransferase family 9 protein [Nanoarchaeota archaeon]MBU1051175.1 glycosyltransferase family 9 protein [Nanoarchaeota archaeon]MBU1988264.1 glycosyltransferase family 9 protein [Nanoarchaeota archaeon]